MFNKPNLTEAILLIALQEDYSLDGTLTELAGYCDLNFLLRTDDKQRFIIKVSSGHDNTSQLQMQNDAMNHLHHRGMPVPNALRNQLGKDISQVSDRDGNRFNYRVLTYLPGTFYADTPSANQQFDLWQSLGSFMGQIDLELSDYFHHEAHRYLEWDLAQGYAICMNKKQFLNAEIATLVEPVLNEYESVVVPILGGLPKGVIHNDANDYNVLVNDSEQPTEVAGLIDFGDLVHSHLINEVAITAAYAIQGQDDPLKTINHITLGYHRKRPLVHEEFRVLVTLVKLRLCTTLCNAALAIKKDPENEYLLISVEPAFNALRQLKEIDTLKTEIALIEFCQSGEPANLTNDEIINFRKTHLGKTLSLNFKEPIKIVRGKGAYLYDEKGNKYLDMVNNVCHVGHCHPDVVAAGQKQMALLNTNTRFLHDNIIQFAEKLIATMPEKLSVCMFVNSGSEANELAFRLAENYSGSRELVVVDGAYHGNTSACINASSYKFDGAGGKGAADNVHKVALPDPYKGEFSNNTDAYADDVGRVISELVAKGKRPGAYICESLQGVAGQIIMPDGYLKKVYERVRNAGGVCIADEVQVGFGRVGSTMWAFETQDVVPDIVTLGKPIGNGHPLAAVITTQEIADAFVTGMEYFNTFGGNPVSCAIGSAVLDVIKNEGLMENARKTGAYFMEQLERLQNEFEIIGDVRGLGLFIGVELVEDRETKQPATEAMNWLIEHFKENNIIMSSEGPGYNVLKIKPPIVFSKENVDQFISVLRTGLEQLGKR